MAGADGGKCVGSTRVSGTALVGASGGTAGFRTLRCRGQKCQLLVAQVDLMWEFVCPAIECWNPQDWTGP